MTTAAAPSGRLIVVLVLATSLGPFAMQVFLPALPAIQTSFEATAASAQLAFSLSTLAIAVATLIYGPVADRMGRRPALLGGLGVYLAGSALCAVAPTLPLLILGRIVQAAGGCAGMVLSRAIVRDLFGREQAAQVLAYVTMAMVAAPMLAPALGGLLTDLLGWRWIFVLGIAVGLIVLVAAMAEIHETGQPGVHVATFGGMISGFVRLLRSPVFCGFALQGGFAMATFFSFLAAAPYVMVQVLDRPVREYGLLFILVAGAFMFGSFAAARLTPRLGSARMILLGVVGALAGAVVTLLLVISGVWHPLAIFVPTSLTAFSQGLSMPNTQAAVVSVDPTLAGSASGLAGFMQMVIAALFAQTIGSIQNDTPYPLAIGMTLAASCALVAALVGLRAEARGA